MTPTELKVLKIVWKNRGKASVSKIANELKISTDYSRLICGSLIRNKIIEFSGGQYKITDLAEKKLGRLGVIEKVKKVTKPLKKTTTRPPPSPPKVGPPAPARAKRKREKIKKATINELSNLTSELIKALKEKGFRTLEDVATTSLSRLMETVEGLELKKAAKMINEARGKLKKEGKEYLWE